jgi:predicted negative regulator of RcsB-dependent stress response
MKEKFKYNRNEEQEEINKLKTIFVNTLLVLLTILFVVSFVSFIYKYYYLNIIKYFLG